MSHLDDKRFAAALGGCSRCDAKAFEIKSYIDRKLLVMLAEPSQDGRWTHDQAKLVDGTYQIRCIACSHDAYASNDCPRCHRPDALPDVVNAVARLAVPQRCPSCKGADLAVLALAPARLRTGEGLPTAPTPIAQFGDVGYHHLAVECEGCGWTARTEACPLCGGQGPRSERATAP